MASIKTHDGQQIIDYLARDYDSFRQALLDLIPKKLPEWTDRSEADFGVALIELFAYMADILSYYQDRIANEAFLATAQERRSIINHLRLIGYELAPAAPATAWLSLVVANNVDEDIVVRKGDQFATASSKERRSVVFEYTGDKPLVISRDELANIAQDSAKKPDGTPFKGFKEIADCIPVREGRTIDNEVIGISDGSANQRFKLAQPQVLRGSLEITVASDPPGPPWRLRTPLIFSGRAFSPEQLAALEWQERIAPTLAFSRTGDQDYSLETDENDVTTVIFGDGEYGRIPPSGAGISANYRVGGGVIGNVGAGQITVITRAPQLQLLGAKVVNRSPANGGAERESIGHAVKFAPTVFTSMQRSVTADDYVALAKLYPGVSKARAVSGSWNSITLFIAPSGGEPPSDILKQELLAYFEDKRMLTVRIDIKSPTYVNIEVAVQVGVVPYLPTSTVETAVGRTIHELFDFDKADFGQTLFLSKIYEAVEQLDGVDHLYVSRFRRAGAIEETAKDGRILLGDNEIAVLDARLGLRIDMSGGQP